MKSLLTRGRRFAVALLAVMASACSGGDDQMLGSNAMGPNGPGWVPTTESCEPGAVRDCGVKLDARNDVVTCYAGSQTCEDGLWSECANGTIETRSLPATTGGSFRTLALSNPADCIENPCDPGCQVYSEEPTSPIQSVDSKPVFNWQNGSLAQYPNGLVKKGLVEPCETGADCQFNTYCSAPSDGTCAHSVCEAGAELANGCTDCVSAVCAKDKTCCVKVPDLDNCSHDPCARGAALKSGCTSCVTDICAKYPTCCTGTWDQTCVDAVVSVCGNSCECASGELHNGRCYKLNTSTKKWSSAQSDCDGTSSSGDWDLVGITDAAENAIVKNIITPSSGEVSAWIGFTDQATSASWIWYGGTPAGTWKETPPSGSLYTNWTATPGTPRCAIMEKAKSGKWTGKACSESAAAVCEGPPEKMKKKPDPVFAWTADCVAKVATECDATCDAKDPKNTAGSCMPWYPGNTDPTCAGVDLAVGVPCDGSVPVCNHGKSQAPAGVKLVHYPANSMQYPSANPGSHPQMETCTTKAVIPAGECINVTDCPMSGNREIMVNPGTSGIAECSQQDNWSLYSKGAKCGAPICAGGNSAASMVKIPVDIIVSIDNSMSMQGEIQSVQDRIDQDLASIVEASGIDYRVIMVTRYGNVFSSAFDGGTATDSQWAVCIGEPLSSIDCPTSALDSTPAVANTAGRFYHHSTDIGSNNMWCRLLESYTKPDPYPVKRTGWTAVAPSGWGAFLRKEAFKVFVGITDDDPLATSATYTRGTTTLPRDCPNMAGDSTLDGTNDATGAKNFDKALKKVAGDQFFQADGTRNYVWYSIAGMTGPKDKPLKPTDAVQKWCCRKDGGVDKTCQGTTGTRLDDAASAGVGYQELSILTGGLRYPSCYHEDFDAMFNAVAKDVIVLASASCELVPATGTAFDPAFANVIYSSIDSKGADVSTTLKQVSGSTACTTNAWYQAGTAMAPLIKLCPTTCDTVKADTNARVWAELACPTKPTETTQTFKYESTCASDEGGMWLDLGYEGVIPDDASITFKARAAKDQASLATEAWVDLRTALTTQPSCPLGSGCEIDVYNKLGAADAILRSLELEVTVKPSGTGKAASLTNWDLTYTCFDNQ